jgi:hypothetical protein
MLTGYCEERGHHEISVLGPQDVVDRQGSGVLRDDRRTKNTAQDHGESERAQGEQSESAPGVGSRWSGQVHGDAERRAAEEAPPAPSDITKPSP